jgi:hypothetical protein
VNRVTGQALSTLSRPEILAAVVPSAAAVSGARADALVTVDPAEHARRDAVGLGAVPDLDVLHALMCLPLDAAIPVDDLGEVVRGLLLERAPAGAVHWLDGHTRVRRRFVPAARVPLVVVRAARWRPAWRRANAFEPFATRVVLLSPAPARVADMAWEADVDGIGLWVARPGGQIDEVVPPAPYVSRYIKPAGWRFAERAYAAWLAAHPLPLITGGSAAVSATAR